MWHKKRIGEPVQILQALQNLIDAQGLDMADVSVEETDIYQVVKDLSSAMQSLCQEKRRAELVLTEIADGIICTDAKGVITLFNRAAESLLKVESDKALGVNIDSADLHPELARMVYECLLSRDTLTSEIRLPGLPETVVGLRAAELSETGQEAGVLLLLHDLSEIRYHEKLQKQFVSNISHELRTPITAVRVTAEALLNGAKNDEEVVDRFLNNIISESDRLAALLSDLMEIAKREAGITQLKPSAVNISKALERAYSTLAPMAAQNEINVSFDVPLDMLAVVDELQFIHLVRNLIDNAIKYTPAGGQVDVTARRLDDGDISISVRDTGIGIPQGELERIFDRFYRVDKARSRKMGGTGLGLAIVKDIVQAHGGKLYVDTQLGKGSTFAVVLPEGEEG